VRRVVLALVPVLLAATGCGDSPGADEPAPASTLAEVTVTGPTGSKPTVDFTAPLSFSKTQRKIDAAGTGQGDAINPTSLVTVDYVGINADDGAEFDSTWSGGQSATFSLTQVVRGFSIGLRGAHAGDRVLIGVAPDDGFPTGNGAAIREGDSLIFVVDVHKVANPLTEATGTTVEPPPTVPELTYDDQGHPEKFVATPRTDEAPTELGVYPIIEGAGAEVQTGQTITVEYVGQLYPDGDIFDESWSRNEPVAFPIGTGQVIKGWDQGLVGQRVGSRVILVIPSNLGYGQAGYGADVPPDADLIFVVDILQAS
jgi:peptidylprolyl isomerase